MINDRFEISPYLKETTLEESRKILMMRLHMINIPCNYQSTEEAVCWMCGIKKVKTKHYFECRELANKWGAKMEDMTSEDTKTLLRASRHLEGAVKRNVLYPYGKITI